MFKFSDQELLFNIFFYCFLCEYTPISIIHVSHKYDISNMAGHIQQSQELGPLFPILLQEVEPKRRYVLRSNLSLVQMYWEILRDIFSKYNI